MKLKKKKKLISRPKHKVYSENITTEHNTKVRVISNFSMGVADRLLNDISMT